MRDEKFIKSYRVIKPVLDYIEGIKDEDVVNWHIGYAKSVNGKTNEIHLTSDNPIVFRLEDKKNVFDQDLIMPLTSGKFLYHATRKELKELKPVFRVNLDIMMFLQSEKYVCGPNGQYLEQVSHLAKRCNAEEIKKEIFDSLHN